MINHTLKFRNPEKLIIILFLSLIFLCCSAVYAQEENKGTVKVTITGLKTDDGQVKVEVFDTEENWTKKSTYEFTCKIKDKKCECTMENIPYGDYAVFAYQDKNSNAELDLINKTLPAEPFGYSRIKQMVMGPARWNDVNFSIASPKMEMEVMLLEIPKSYLESMKKQQQATQTGNGR